MYRIQCTLVQQVGSQGLGKLHPCGFSGCNPHGYSHRLELSTCNFSTLGLQVASGSTILRSGEWQLPSHSSARQCPTGHSVWRSQPHIFPLLTALVEYICGDSTTAAGFCRSVQAFHIFSEN